MPTSLAAALVEAAHLRAAVETGTFHGHGALALRVLVPAVWSIELSQDLHARAQAAHGSRPGLRFLQGRSDEVLLTLSGEISEPVLFWLDAHSGTDLFDIDDDVPQCPLLGELAAIRRFPAAGASCILVDDARAFLGPLAGPHIRHRSADWPTLAEVVDALRVDSPRYVTILDDVVIAVPPELRPVVDRWWCDQLEARNGKEAHAHLLDRAVNPSPAEAARRLVKSLLPPPVRQALQARRRRPVPGGGRRRGG